MRQFDEAEVRRFALNGFEERARRSIEQFCYCLLYTSDAADDLLCVDLGGRRIIKKKKNYTNTNSSYPV